MKENLHSELDGTAIPDSRWPSPEGLQVFEDRLTGLRALEKAYIVRFEVCVDIAALESGSDGGGKRLQRGSGKDFTLTLLTSKP